MIRLLLALCFFLSIFFAPLFLPILLGIALLFFRDGYETLVGGVLLDALYGVPIPLFFGLPIFYTLMFSLLFLLISSLKPRLRSYERG